ncbi:MAG: DUF5320 domain-containing protein [Chitinispirillaceae bacterium]
MPYGDGTGPFGLGPGTGRKRGWCAGGRKVAFWSLAAPVAAALVRDVMNPGGVLRGCVRQLLGGRKAEKRIGKDAEFSVLDNGNTSFSSQSDEKVKVIK